nr:hypothetical protein [uncultured Methanolobus sp.]
MNIIVKIGQVGERLALFMIFCVLPCTGVWQSNTSSMLKDFEERLI